MNLGAREMEHAISIAATQAAGLMASQHESMVKRMHAGRASQSGVYGAELADRGFTGIDHVFEAEYGGYCSTLSDDADLSLLTSRLKSKFETDVVGFKTYSCCGSTQTSVEAVKRIRRRTTIAPSDIVGVEVRTSTATLLHVGWAYEPKSITSAQMNLPYCLAVTVFDGNAFVEQFTEAKIHDPAICALARRVHVIADPAVDALGSTGRHRVTVTIKLRDGSQLAETVDHAKGSDADPLTPEEVVAKYFQLAEPVAGRAWATDMHDVAMTIDRSPGLTDLQRLLSVRHRR
jgi:2-methylcitrate dehydratase PrpD